MAHVSLGSIQPTYKRGVACISLMCHTPFISDYSHTSKCLLTSARDVALELRAYKSLKAYKYFYDGYVKSVWVFQCSRENQLNLRVWYFCAFVYIPL